jgi:hypothetical protein
MPAKSQKQASLKSIKKQCELCNAKLIIKSRRDIIRKRFCSRKCKEKEGKSYLTPEGKMRLILKNSGPNPKKSCPKYKNGNWAGGGVEHLCLICNKQFLVPVSRHNMGYGKWCSKVCEKRHHSKSYENIKCLMCDKEMCTLKKKKKKFCSISCRASFYIKTDMFGKSKSEKEFLDYLCIKNRNVPIGKFIVDGIDGNVIYEFLGDYFHGNPMIFINKDEINVKAQKTFGELYTLTFERFKKLKNMGYEIKYIWESDWKLYKKNIICKPNIQSYLL